MSLAAFVFFNGLLLVAAVYDLRSFRIPNQLSLVMAAAAVPLSPPASAEEAIGRLATVAIIGLVALGLYLKNALGGGDVKLLAACGLWIPLSGLPTFATALGLAGGLQAIGTLVLIRLSPDVKPYLARDDYHRMPYAVSIVAAGLVVGSAT